MKMFAAMAVRASDRRLIMVVKNLLGRGYLSKLEMNMAGITVTEEPNKSF